MWKMIFFNLCYFAARSYKCQVRQELHRMGLSLSVANAEFSPLGGVAVFPDDGVDELHA
jgi:hypothetical protein